MPSTRLGRLQKRLHKVFVAHIDTHAKLVRRYSFAEAIMYDQFESGLELNDFLHFCYAKSARTLDAVAVLIEADFREDPAILLRSAYENYLTFWYVLRNQEAVDAFVDSKVGKKAGIYVHPSNGAGRHLKVVDQRSGELKDYGRSMLTLAKNGSPRIRAEFHQPFYEYLSEHCHNHFISMGNYLADGFRGKFTSARPGKHLETAVFAALISTLWLECMPLFEDMDDDDLKDVSRLTRRAHSGLAAALKVLHYNNEAAALQRELQAIVQSLETRVAL